MSTSNATTKTSWSPVWSAISIKITLWPCRASSMLKSNRTTAICNIRILWSSTFWLSFWTRRNLSGGSPASASAWWSSPAGRRINFSKSRRKNHPRPSPPLLSPLLLSPPNPPNLWPWAPPNFSSTSNQLPPPARASALSRKKDRNQLWTKWKRIPKDLYLLLSTTIEVTKNPKNQKNLAEEVSQFAMNHSPTTPR